MITGAAAAAPASRDVRTVTPAASAAASRLASNATRSRCHPVPKGLNMKSGVDQLVAAPCGAVAEAAEVVDGDEGVVAEDVVDGLIESGWRPLADAETAVALAVDDEEHRAAGAGEGGGGGASGWAGADHDGVVTGPPSHTIGSISCHAALQVVVGSEPNPTLVSTSITAGNAPSVGPGCWVTRPRSAQWSTMLASVSGRLAAATKRCQS